MKKAIEEIVEARAMNELNTRLMADERYREADKEYIAAFSKVENTLGGEHDELVLALEAATNGLLAVVEEQAYRLGVEDGPKIKREFAKQGLSFEEEETE